MERVALDRLPAVRSLGEWSGLRAFAALMALACAVSSAVAIGRPGGAPVVTLALALGAVVALVSLRGVGDVIAGILVISAAVAGAHELVAPGPYDFDEIVLGTAIPQAVTHLAWWTACFSALALVLAVVLRGRVAGKAVLGGVGAVVVVAALTPGAIAVADGVGRSLLAEAAPRTTAPDDLVAVPDSTLPADLRTGWSKDFGADDLELNEGRAIPDYGLTVLLRANRGDGMGVRAVDTRTGAERWSYGIDSSQAHVSPAHRRVLVSDGGAGVVLDLVTGATIGVIAFPPAEEHWSWQGMGQERLVLAGRTAVLSTGTVGGLERLLAVDMVALTATRVGELEDCHHRYANGVADHVVVMRTGLECPHPALLRVSGDGLAHTTEVGDGEITNAHVVRGGVVVEVEERGFAAVALYRDGVAEPVVFGRARSYDRSDVVVLTGPDRVVLAGPEPERVYDDRTGRLVEVRQAGRVFDVASGRLVGRAELAGEDTYGDFSQVGNRVVQVWALAEDRGVLRVRDATSMAEVGSVEIPCHPMSASASAAGVLVRCVNPRQFLVFVP